MPLLGVCLFCAEGDGAAVHGVDDGKALQAVAQFADPLAALLETLFDDDAAALHGGFGVLHQGDEALQGIAVGQKIVDDQHPIALAKEFSGNHHLVDIAAGEGGNFRPVHRLSALIFPEETGSSAA